MTWNPELPADEEQDSQVEQESTLEADRLSTTTALVAESGPPDAGEASWRKSPPEDSTSEAPAALSAQPRAGLDLLANEPEASAPTDSVEASQEPPGEYELISAAAQDRRSNLMIALASIFAGLLALTFVEMDPLLATLGELRYWPLAGAVLVSILSFLFGAAGLRWLMDRPWNQGALYGRGPLHITVLSQLASNLLSFGGLTGAMMRARLLAGPERRWPEATVTAVIYSIALNGCSLAITLTAGILLALPLQGWDLLPYGSGLAFLFALLMPFVFSLGSALVILAHGSIVTRAAHSLGERLGRRLGLSSSLVGTHSLLEKALADPWGILGATIFMSIDWLLVALILSLSFEAAGAALAFDGLLACFGAGSLAILLSFVPAGIGALEASLATVAVKSYGVPLERALVAVILYRVIYYGTPLPLSLIKDEIKSQRPQ